MWACSGSFPYGQDHDLFCVHDWDLARDLRSGFHLFGAQNPSFSPLNVNIWSSGRSNTRHGPAIRGYPQVFAAESTARFGILSETEGARVYSTVRVLRHLRIFDESIWTAVDVMDVAICFEKNGLVIR